MRTWLGFKAADFMTTSSLLMCPSEIRRTFLINLEFGKRKMGRSGWITSELPRLAEAFWKFRFEHISVANFQTEKSLLHIRLLEFFRIFWFRKYANWIKRCNKLNLHKKAHHNKFRGLFHTFLWLCIWHRKQLLPIWFEEEMNFTLNTFMLPCRHWINTLHYIGSLFTEPLFEIIAPFDINHHMYADWHI